MQSWDTVNNCCTCTVWCHQTVMGPKDVEDMTNSENSDQTNVKFLKIWIPGNLL